LRAAIASLVRSAEQIFIYCAQELEGNREDTMSARALAPNFLERCTVSSLRLVVFATLLGVSWLHSIPLAAQSDPIDKYIETELQQRHVPAMSLAIVKNGRVVKASGYGLANTESRVPATPNTVYQLASATKPFTATGIMLLVEDGKIGLGDPVTKYVDGLPTAWNEITVRHLLTHTSGILSYLRSPDLKWNEDYTPDRIIKLAAVAPLVFSPGEKWEYCNTGYVLLAKIIQNVTGKPYDEFLAERVFKPLGMAATRRGSADGNDPNLASSYQWEHDAIVNAEPLNPTLWNNGDGGLVSTVLDLAKFNLALDEGRILKESSRRQMWTESKLQNGYDARTMFNDGYGYGWFLDYDRGHRLIWHSGGRPGAVSVMSRFADDKLTVILLANRDGWNPVGMSRVVAGLFDPALAAPSMMKVDPKSDERQIARFQAVLSDVASGRKDPSLMTADECAAISENGDANIADKLKTMDSFAYISKESIAGRQIELGSSKVSDLYYYKLIGAGKTTFFTFFVNSDGKVALVQSSSE
jgi:CubicO group peptidase (beta-lactamase class C family)